MKTYDFTIAIASLLLLMLMACCSDHVTDRGNGSDDLPIRFDGKAGLMTRVTDTETLLSDNIKDFTVYGINGKLFSGSFTKNTGVAFPNYVVWFSQKSSQTNTDNWEYVGEHPSGDKYSTLSEEREADTRAQVIKYWDKTQDTHYFWAIGKASKGIFSDVYSDGRVKSITVDQTKISPDSEVLYYTDPTMVKVADYGNPVRMVFKKILAQIRFGFYEAIEEETTDGNRYSIKNLKLYGPGTSPETDAYGFSTSIPVDATAPCVMGSFPTDGSVTINYNYVTDGTGSSTVTATPTTTDAPAFLTLHQPVVSSEKPLATTSTNPTFLNDGQYYNVFPCANNNGITIKCHYKIYNQDTGAESRDQTKYATVPAEYCNWQSGYQYTYLFKISDSSIDFLCEIQRWDEKEQSNDDGKGTQGW